jgi:hypothetical protein
MQFRVFYFFSRSGESISSVSAVEMSARAIRDQLLRRLQSEDDYLGILDAEENTLQILREPGEDRYWVELPIDAARASYGRYMGLAELEDLIVRLPQLFDRSRIPDMEYRPW